MAFESGLGNIRIWFPGLGVLGLGPFGTGSGSGFRGLRV